MTTLQVMRNSIIDELGDEGALTNAQIDTAIRRAIKHYERRPWWFNQKKNATFSTVGGQEYYGATELSDIPNIVQIDAAAVTVGGSKCALSMINFPDVDADQSGTSTGSPTALTRYANELRVSPIPNDVYTITLAYIYKLAELTLDTDTNAWMTDAEELIRQAAKKRLALDVLHSDHLAVRMAPLEKEAYDELLAENRRRLPQKLLRVDAALTRQTFDIYAG